MVSHKKESSSSTRSLSRTWGFLTDLKSSLKKVTEEGEVIKQVPTKQLVDCEYLDVTTVEEGVG